MSAKAQILPFDLRSLEIFLAVCETGTVAGAAREFGMTQPAVSLAVAEIERKTGISFFDREVRPLALTMAGGLLRQHATALIADARQVVPLLRETKHGKVPLIRTFSDYAEANNGHASQGTGSNSTRSCAFSEEGVAGVLRSGSENW